MNADLIRLVVSEFQLDTKGIHDPSHWFRVRKNGLLLSDIIKVIFYGISMESGVMEYYSSYVIDEKLGEDDGS